MRNLLFAPILLSTLVALSAQTTPTTAPIVECASLVNATIDSASIGLPTTGARVSSAQNQQAPGDLEPVCVVLGAIAPVDPTAPSIHFQLNLPAAWNGKALHQGGGGFFDGYLVTGRNPYFLPPDREPVHLGYATFGSDSGHQGGHGDLISAAGDASFATNDEALRNFGGEQLKKTHDVAIALIARYYGHAPHRTYFSGNSQGGHEGLIVAQRYPADYDGVVSIHPAYNFTELQLDGLALSQALYKNSAAWLSPEKTRLVNQAVTAQCDSLDGLKDGLISNVAACRSAFDLSTLRCPQGSDSGPTCLSDAQIATLHTLSNPVDFPADIGGFHSVPGWPVLEGAFAPGSFFGLGTRFPPGNPPTYRDAFAFLMADEGFRFMLLRDPSYSTLQFHIADHLDALRRLSTLIDANSPNLDAFRRHGGKLLLLHSTVDMAIPPGNSVWYYQHLQARYGKKLPAFARFYVVPGFGHGDGPFPILWDSLSTLDAWVEAGTPPANLTVTDASPAGDGRTRPLCEYPAWPRYNGTGNPLQAASFHCTEDPR